MISGYSDINPAFNNGTQRSKSYSVDHHPKPGSPPTLQHSQSFGQTYTTITAIQRGTRTVETRTMSTRIMSTTTTIQLHTMSRSHTTSAVSRSHTTNNVLHTNTISMSAVSDSSTGIHTTSHISTISMSDSHTSSSRVTTPTPSSGGIPQQYRIILYTVPPLGGVVCCLISLALCLALRRYRK